VPAAAAPIDTTPPLQAPPVPTAKEPDDLPAAPPRDFATRASELMSGQMPRIAQRAERLVLRVLFLAAHAQDGSQDDAIRAAARAIRLAPQEPPLETEVSAHDATLLDEAARVAFFRRSSAQEALRLQTRAFGANPQDAEVVGNLAFLHLKQRPAQPDAARQLALHALTMADARHPHGRLEDWTTLAIASALTGRDRDARNAWFVTIALAPDLDPQCRAAVNAHTMYGERLRASVEAMLYRVQASGRAGRSPLCEWPPYWRAAGPLR
jgi:tetratricopeptide (TPR) repeat protein